MEQNGSVRGFKVFQFRDDYGAYCSLQESSSVEPHIWLGMTKDSDGSPVGKIFEGKSLGARMHLNQAQVNALLPMLQFFAQHGYLPTEDEQPAASTTVINCDPDGTQHIVVRFANSKAWDVVHELLSQLRDEYDPHIAFMANSTSTPPDESANND